METLLAGEIQGQVDVVDVYRHVLLAQLPSSTRFGWIDRKALAVNVRPAPHQKRGTADVNQISHAEHPAIRRRDSDRIFPRVVVAAEKRQLLRRLQIPIRAVLRQMSHLSLGVRRENDKRKCAEDLLHLIDSKIFAGHLRRLLDTEHRQYSWRNIA